MTACQVFAYYNIEAENGVGCKSGQMAPGKGFVLWYHKWVRPIRFLVIVKRLQSYAAFRKQSKAKRGKFSISFERQEREDSYPRRLGSRFSCHNQ